MGSVTKLKDVVRLSVLSPARLASVEFDPKDPPGTWQYLFRLVGRVSKVRSSTTYAGPKIRLAGEFVAGRPTQRLYSAAFMLVPEAIAEAVREELELHPKADRRALRVLIAYDVWAIRRESTLGYEYHCSGKAWVPDPMLELLEAFHHAPPKKPVTT